MFRTTLLVFLLAALSACGVSVEPLMPTPVIYTDTTLDPFAHLPEADQTPVVDIFYVTNRDRVNDWQQIRYGNRAVDRVDLGAAAMRIGGPDMTWQRLHDASTAEEREKPIEIELSGIIRRGGFALDAPEAELTLESRQFVDAINARLARTEDPEIFIYVHGAKVNFYNACAFTSQLGHFMGRDIVGVAFSWPTRQDILAYAFGQDVRRAETSAHALAASIEFLAAHTDARRINIICWSAGARVVTRALESLPGRHPELSSEALRDKFRIGTVVYAAADIPLTTWVPAARSIDDLADRVVVSVSNDDVALVKASQLMGGGRRLGQYGRPLADDEREVLESLERIEFVDVSYARDDRGFNIGGHRYWFNHRWASTDILLALRLGLDPQQRGLERVEGYDQVWFIPPDYPQRLKAIVDQYKMDDWYDGPE